MRNVVILGSTGSIGTQSLDVIRNNGDRFKVAALACGYNTELLCEQIEEFRPEMVSVAREEDAIKIGNRFPKIDVHWGEQGLIDVAKMESATMVLNGLMGMKGLVPTYYAIENKKDIAFANKETLVAGGQLIMGMVEKHGVKMLPVDSEHSAIFQCLQGNADKEVRRILLTASGGPFRGYNLRQLSQVTLEQALNHPNWSMGKKITIDSATMMNKGLEVIEARWLFDVELEKIQILVHPQSIVHSAVEFDDTSVIGQMGLPDMRIPISIALAYPERLHFESRGVDFFREGANLTFEEADRRVFKCIDLAYEASRAGGSYPVVLNSANEVLVDKFLKGKIGFIDIQEGLERILDEHNPIYNLTLDGIMEMDEKVRKDLED